MDGEGDVERTGTLAGDPEQDADQGDQRQEELVVLSYVQQRPERRGDDDRSPGAYLRPPQPLVEKSPEQRFFEDRRGDHEREPEQRRVPGRFDDRFHDRRYRRPSELHGDQVGQLKQHEGEYHPTEHGRAPDRPERQPGSQVQAPCAAAAVQDEQQEERTGYGGEDYAHGDQVAHAFRWIQVQHGYQDDRHNDLQYQVDAQHQRGGNEGEAESRRWMDSFRLDCVQRGFVHAGFPATRGPAKDKRGRPSV